MSCDYQRNRIWCGFRSWYRHHISEAVRTEFENIAEDFVKEWIENALEDEGKRVVGEYKERKTKPQKPVRITLSEEKKKKGKKTGKGKSPAKLPVIEKHIIADPDPFERVYRQAKEIIVPGHVNWTDDQREEMAGKMHRIMHWMRVHGETPDANPIHGKHGLPRISSVAAYAVVHDWLTAQGMKMKSPFDPVFEAVWNDPKLDAEKIHELEHLIADLEIEKNKRQNASLEQEEEILLRIQKISPETYNLLFKKFPQFRALQPV